MVPISLSVHIVEPENVNVFTGNEPITTLEIEKAALNGLEGILRCACQAPETDKALPAMNSMTFANFTLLI